MGKQNILEYEVEMIDYHSESLSKPDSSLNHQYTTWQLDQKISSLMGQHPYTIRWIGNHQSAYIDTFVYIMLSMSLRKQKLLVKLKEKIYQLARKYLPKSNQKLIVQFLCLMQYTQDKYSFFRKYPEVVKMIVSCLKTHEKEATHRDNLKISSFILQSPLKEKRKQSFCIFSSKFNFITVSQPQDFAYKFKCQKQVVYTVVQKDCFFVIERNPAIKDVGMTSGEKKGLTFKTNTPTLIIVNNSAQKPKSQNKLLKNHISQKKPFKCHELDQDRKYSSPQCSIEEIHSFLENRESPRKPIRKLEFQKFMTENCIPSRSPTKLPKKLDKIDPKNQNLFLIRQLEFQQKRRQHWLMLEREYYKRKNEISKKIKKSKISIKNQPQDMFASRYDSLKAQKQRKMSFNSFTGHLHKDRYDSEFGQSNDDDSKSITKSLQSQKFRKETMRQRKISGMQSPQKKCKKMQKKKKSNQIYVSQENRLSVIEQQNRLKFWNFNSRTNNQHKSPKITSKNSSNRETLDSNICVSFKYVSKCQGSSKILSSPIIRKKSYNGSPLQV